MFGRATIRLGIGPHSSYYKFTVEFAGETIFKISERSVELQAKRLIVSHALCAWALSCIMKNSPSILRMT